MTDAIRPKPYDLIVGLGYDCRPTYNLRRTFGNPRAFPFDWWVTPLAGLAAFLADPSLDRLYDPGLLEESRDERGIRAIRNAHYDIELHHEFPRTPDNAVVPDWREHIQRPRERTQFLLNRLLSTPDGSRLLFVRSSHKSDGRAPGRRFAALIGEAHERLRALFPRSSVELLLIDPLAEIEAPGVINLEIGDTSKERWQGVPELWTERLLGAGLAWSGEASNAPPPVNPERDQVRYTA